jgi:hypothetical protein
VEGWKTWTGLEGPTSPPTYLKIVVFAAMAAGKVAK